MNGVEILATEKVVSEYGYTANHFWIGFFIMVGIGIFISILILFDEDYDTTDKVTGIIMTLFFCVAIAYPIGLLTKELGSKPIAYETRYKVTISDKVKMNEFYERYKIINQEGKIYTVEEREDYK